jgi:hypothetical protein
MFERVYLPSRFESRQMTYLAREVAKRVKDHTWPSDVIFDFSSLQFIRPSGVVFLHNLIHWMHEKECQVHFDGHAGTSAALRYLSDSQFFLSHLGPQCEQMGMRRPTTCPLIDLKYERSQAWIRQEFIPWVASQASVSEASLYGLQSSMAEIFNNIQDHSRYDIGSIFGQYFPMERSINIAVSDMGIGIPNTVRRVSPQLSDSSAIVEAVKIGFTAKSVQTNSGMGLDQLLRAVVMELGGAVTIYSGTGIVYFSLENGVIRPTEIPDVGFCPGTTIEIKLDPGAIPNRPNDEEDIQW